MVHSSDLAMRAKRAKLSTAIEMMRREAVHNAFNAARGGPSPTADGAGDEEGALSGMDARRAQEWVAISEIPSYRLVHFVFECIDADRSGGLTALPVNPRAHQFNPPRPPTPFVAAHDRGATAQGRWSTAKSCRRRSARNWLRTGRTSTPTAVRKTVAPS